MTVYTYMLCCVFNTNKFIHFRNGGKTLTDWKSLSLCSCLSERIVYTLSFIHIKCLLIIQLQVNIIPIVAKSDAISKSELAKFKIKITSELVSNGVQIYQFPTDDESVAEINSTMNVSLSLRLNPHLNVKSVGCVLLDLTYFL